MKWILVLVAALALLGCAGDGEKHPASSRDAYSGWCKFYNRTDITIDEWVAMRRWRVLPGMQFPNNHSSSLATGVAVGAVMGSAMTAGKR